MTRLGERPALGAKVSDVRAGRQSLACVSPFGQAAALIDPHKSRRAIDVRRLHARIQHGELLAERSRGGVYSGWQPGGVTV